MFKNARNKLATLGLMLVAALTLGTPAMAATGDVGDTVSTAIASANPQIIAVIGAMAAALVIIVTWRLVSKAFGGK